MSILLLNGHPSIAKVTSCARFSPSDLVDAPFEEGLELIFRIYLEHHLMLLYKCFKLYKKFFNGIKVRRIRRKVYQLDTSTRTQYVNFGAAMK